MRTLIGLLWVVLVGGCVTETTGNLPEPATLNERVQAQLDLARGYLENRDFTRARSPLNRALEIDPRSVEANVLMGVLSQAESDPELAEQHFKSALRLEPDNAQALNNYASFLYAQQRYSEAVERLRKLVRDPDYRARSQATKIWVWLSCDSTISTWHARRFNARCCSMTVRPAARWSWRP